MTLDFLVNEHVLVLLEKSVFLVSKHVLFYLKICVQMHICLN